MQTTDKAIDAEEAKTVDIDTSGPDTEVELNPTEAQSTDTSATESTEETSVETVAAEPTQETEETNEEATQKTEEANAESEKKDNELKEYSESVQKRIAKLTKKMREAERQRDEALTYAKTELQRRKELDEKLSSTTSSSLSAKETSIKSGLEAAKAKLAQARADNDINAEIEAQQAISTFAYEQAKLIEEKKAFDDKAATPVKEEKQPTRIAPQQTAAPDPKAEAWAEKNDWFGKDSAMTYTAFDLHKQLVDQEGYDPESDEYYSEIDKRIRLEFPNKFDKPESNKVETAPKPTQTVASAKRSVKQSRKTVRLTPSQVAIAKKLGVPLEEYAKQLNTKE